MALELYSSMSLTLSIDKHATQQALTGSQALGSHQNYRVPGKQNAVTLKSVPARKPCFSLLVIAVMALSWAIQFMVSKIRQPLGIHRSGPICTPSANARRCSSGHVFVTVIAKPGMPQHAIICTVCLACR